MRKYWISKRKQWWTTLPRIPLALLIGITISRPLELKIFEKEINTKVVENIHKKVLQNDSLIQLENRKTLQTTVLERNRLQLRKTGIEDTLYQLQQAYLREADGTGGSGQKGIESLTRLKMDAWQKTATQLAPELQQLTVGIRMQDSILNQANASIEERRKQYEKAAIANVGFLERNKALSDLASEESSVFWSGIFISLLIILIEVGPVLSKLIMPVGPYDIALAKEELTQMAQSENEMRQDKEVVFEKKKVFYQKQKEMSNTLLNKMAELQQKYIDEELDKWERGEWNDRDHRASMDAVVRKIKERYYFKENDLL
jgi:hypothetical protein